MDPGRALPGSGFIGAGSPRPDRSALDVPVGDFSLADRQVVEIARALVGNPTLIVMDEATSSVGPVDAQRLFQVVDQLKAIGLKAIVRTSSGMRYSTLP